MPEAASLGAQLSDRNSKRPQGEDHDLLAAARGAAPLHRWPVVDVLRPRQRDRSAGQDLLGRSQTHRSTRALSDQACVRRSGPTGLRAGRRQRRARRPVPPRAGESSDPAMMRWPGSSAAPWSRRKSRTKAAVTAGSSVSEPLAGGLPVLRHGHGNGEGVDAAHVRRRRPPRADRCCRRGQARCRRRRCRDRPARARVPDRPLSVDRSRRAAPPEQRPRPRRPERTSRRARRSHRRAGRRGPADSPPPARMQAEVLLNGRGVEADLPAHLAGALATAASLWARRDLHPSGHPGGRFLGSHVRQSRAVRFQGLELCPAGAAIPCWPMGSGTRRDMKSLTARLPSRDSAPIVIGRRRARPAVNDARTVFSSVTSGTSPEDTSRRGTTSSMSVRIRASTRWRNSRNARSGTRRIRGSVLPRAWSRSGIGSPADALFLGGMSWKLLPERQRQDSPIPDRQHHPACAPCRRAEKARVPSLSGGPASA